MTHPNADPRTPRPARRWLVRIAVVVVLAVVVVGLAPAVVARTRLRDTILNRVLSGPILAGTVHSESASLGWFSPVAYTGVKITDPNGAVVSTGGSLSSSKTLLQLALAGGEYGEFTWANPTVTVACRPGGTALEDLIAPILAPSSEPTGGPNPGVVLHVTGGTMILTEAGRPNRTLSPVDLTVTVVPPPDEPVVLTATAGSSDAGRFDATFEFAKESTAKLRADRFSLADVGPLVRRFGPGTDAAGRLTADLDLTWAEHLHGSTRLTAAGRADVADLDLTADWLGPDRVRMSRAGLPAELTLDGDTLTIKSAMLACDVGTASAVGVVNLAAPTAGLLDRPGQQVAANVDVARLSALLPNLLRVRAGTELTAGRVAVTFATTAEPTGGTGWQGSLDATALTGSRDGRPLAWDQPLSVAFAGRTRPDGLPEFDKLEGHADFVDLSAKGSPESFAGRATVDLDRLSAHLREFVDLGGVTLAGTANAVASCQVRADRAFAFTGGAKLTNFAFADGRGGRVTDPALDLTLSATGRLADADAGPVRIDAGECVIAAGPDRADLRLLAPIADVSALSSGAASAKLVGDIGRWRTRVAAFAPVPAIWTVAGAGSISADVTFAPDLIRADNVAADVKDVSFVGLGLIVDEPEIIANGGVSVDRKSGTVTVSDLKLSSATTSLAARTVELTPAADGGLTGKGTVAVVAKIDRVMRTVGVVVPDPALTPTGTAHGTVGFDLGRGGVLTFDATGTVKDLVVGPPAAPTWAEPAVDFAAKGDWDVAAGNLRLVTARGGRDGLTIDARGTVADMTRTAGLDLDGTIAYDLAKLEPTLRAFLGKGTVVRGSGVKPFAVRGPLGRGTDRVAVNVGGPFMPIPRTPAAPQISSVSRSAGPLADLNGSASVEWDALRAFGFDVGKEEVSAALTHGKLALTPIDAEFGGGRVRVRPTLDLTSPGYPVTFAPGRVVDNAKLSPDALDGTLGALGYALPAFANVAQAEGTVSFDLADGATVPLTDVAKSSLTGNLTVHAAQVSPGPLVSEILTLLNADRAVLATSAEQVVPVAIKDGVVYHDGFRMTVEKTAVTTKGAVGMDGKMFLEVGIQFPPKIADEMFPNNPRVRDALLQQVIKLPVTGTIGKPQFQPGAFRNAIREMTRNAARGATQDLLGDLLKKGLEK